MQLPGVGVLVTVVHTGFMLQSEFILGLQFAHAPLKTYVVHFALQAADPAHSPEDPGFGSGVHTWLLTLILSILTTAAACQTKLNESNPATIDLSICFIFVIIV